MMRLLTPEETEKLKFLDTLFLAIPKEELARMAEEEEVIAILKDKPIAPGIFFSMYEENLNLRSAVSRLENQMYTHETALKELVTALNRTVFNSQGNSEFYSLRCKLGIY